MPEGASAFSNPANRALADADAYVNALLELLGPREPLAVMKELVPELRGLLQGLDQVALRQPEAPGKWSVIQVVEHLADQELVNSFRFRKVLAEDQPAISGYDQDSWAQRLHYGSTPESDVLDVLAALRRRNLGLLEALTAQELERVGHHAERGPESIRRMVQLTAGHDLAHRGQLARIRAALAPTR